MDVDPLRSDGVCLHSCQHFSTVTSFLTSSLSKNSSYSRFLSRWWTLFLAFAAVTFLESSTVPVHRLFFARHSHHRAVQPTYRFQLVSEGSQVHTRDLSWCSVSRATASDPSRSSAHCSFTSTPCFRHFDYCHVHAAHHTFAYSLATPRRHRHAQAREIVGALQLAQLHCELWNRAQLAMVSAP